MTAEPAHPSRGASPGTGAPDERRAGAGAGRGAGPWAATSRAASLERLHGLVRTVNGDLDLGRTLQSVCQGVVDGLGFEVAVMNLVMPDGALEVVACAGNEQARAALMGTRAGRDTWDGVMAACEPLGELLVDYAHRVPVDGALATWVPDTQASDDPDGWQPLDELFAPLRTARSGLVGVISVDLPRDGRRPGPEQRELLEMYAAQASVAVENAQLHTALLEQHAERSEALVRLSSLVSSTPVAIVELDLEGTVRLWNPAAERIFGWAPEDVLGGRNPVVEEHEYLTTLQGLWEHPLVRVQARRRRRDGLMIDIEMSASVLRDALDRPFGYLGVYADVTDRTLLEQELRAAAHTDPLTGLANRAGFTERLEAAASSPTGATVLLLDLDGFKAVNDTAGHAAGDRVLVEVARRTLAACRTTDLVARLGGDEFVVLIDGRAGDGDGVARAPAAADGQRGEQDGEALAARLVRALAVPVTVGPAHVRLGASVGLARLRGPGSGDDLLRDADVAMYDAKSRGKGRFSVFEPQLRTELVERTELLADLRRALERDDELFVRWHPVVRVREMRLAALEALVRWQHPERGELPPAVFLGLAEEGGLMVDLGRAVLHRACRTMRRWQDDLPRCAPPRISVNVAPVQVHSGIVGTVREVLADTRVHPARLVLELTEGVLLQDVDEAVEVMAELRALGVALAVDDFGAGYSSLAYLKRLPVDVVKLDRSLLVGVDDDPSALALFDAVVGLVGRLGRAAVAEGVETATQWSLLERLRCPLAQGFLLARPLLEADVPRLLLAGALCCGLSAAG